MRALREEKKNDLLSLYGQMTERENKKSEIIALIIMVRHKEMYMILFSQYEGFYINC